MLQDHRLIFEAYKTRQISENLGLGPSAINEYGDTTMTATVGDHKCHCSHGKRCSECDQGCGCSEDCEYPMEQADEDLTNSSEFTAMAKQQLFRIHRLAEELHELVDHEAFQPWMASKITDALTGLSHIYDKVDYDVSVKSKHQSIEPDTFTELHDHV